MKIIIILLTLFILNIHSIAFCQKVITREKAVKNAIEYAAHRWTANIAHVNQWESNAFGYSGGLNTNWWLGKPMPQYGIPYAYAGKDLITTFIEQMNVGGPITEPGPRSFTIPIVLGDYGIWTSDFKIIGRSNDSGIPVTITITDFQIYGSYVNLWVELRREYFEKLHSGQVVNFSTPEIQEIFDRNNPPTPLYYYNEATGRFFFQLMNPNIGQVTCTLHVTYPSACDQDHMSPGWNKEHWLNFGGPGNNPMWGGTLCGYTFGRWGTGIDCSGLVTRAWEFPQTYVYNTNVVGLATNWVSINGNEAQIGDILINPNQGHVVMISFLNPDEMIADIVHAVGMASSNKCIIQTVNLIESPYSTWSYYKNPNLNEKSILKDVGNNFIRNNPNPFNQTTTIAYYLGTTQKIEISIYNVLGQKVITLFEGRQIKGVHKLKWNGTNQFGNTLSSGIYIYLFKTESEIITHKMILIK